MRDRAKCKKCKYRGGTVDTNTMFCNYAFIAEQTCLHKVGKKIVDRRGKDPKNCLCFELERGAQDS